VAIANGDNELTPSSRESLQGLYEELVDVEIRLKNLNSKIRQLCRQNEKCQRILKIPGVGELTATAIVAAVPNSGEFRNGRHSQPGWGLFHGNRPVATSRFSWASVNEATDIYGHY
jgi:transposase